MFSTERLLVRQILPDDYDAMMVVYGDPEGMRWVDDGEPITAEDCRRWIDVTIANYGARGYGMSAVSDLVSGETVGFCGLVHPGGQETPELKYAYARKHWGVGYATEVAKGMISYGRREFSLDHIIATTAPENVASHRVLLKSGMTDSGITVDDDGDRVQLFEWHAAAGS